MKKLRCLKEWNGRKIGDIFNAGKMSAENYVSQGFAKYVEEDNKKVIEKPIILSGDKDMSYDLVKLTTEFQKYLKLDDTKLMMLHTALAVMLSKQMEGTPIWIIFVGASGDGKSEITVSLDDKINTFMLHEITSNTLVSGFQKSKKVGKNYVKINCDLAPKLDNKVVLIPDMAQILKLHPNEKAKVWAQLRELYDGRASKKTGNMEEQKRYDSLRVTLIACSTPAIDSQILIHQDLGTRELIFRTNTEAEEKHEEGEQTLQDKVWENEGHEDLMRTALKISVSEFLRNRPIKKIDISDEVKKELEAYVEVLRYLRASAEIDSFSGELISLVYPEQPTRALKQLKRLFISLKSLDDDYPDELALQIIGHIVKSSCSFNRWLVLSGLSRYTDRISISTLAQDIKLGTKTIYRELNTLWNLGLIDRTLEQYSNYGKTFEAQFWIFKATPLNQKIKELFKKIPGTPKSITPYYFSIRTFFIMKKEKKNNNIDNTYTNTAYHDTPNSIGTNMDIEKIEKEFS